MFFLDYFKKKDYKKVLSLDGGGVRGLASVIFLKQLENSIDILGLLQGGLIW